MTLMHATCVTIDGTGILLRGASGAGKSDLALRLIDGGAVLVADDYCEVTATSGHLLANAPDTIAGKLEVRGYGIVEFPCVTNAPIALAVDLMPAEHIPRLPETTTCVIAGITLPWICIDPVAPSAAARIRLAARLTVKPREMTHP